MPADLIYLDNHATTRCDPRVVQTMLPWFADEFGNAGSLHACGQTARDAVERSRAALADVIGAEADEIVFTSGATESNNLAIRGVAERPRRRGDHLVSVATEHRAVLDPLAQLAKRGYEVTLLPVDSWGLLDPQRVVDALKDSTCLVSVMLANNEIGVVQPICQIARACRERGVLLHCDATQAIGKLPVQVNELGVDLMSFTAHKIYGPKGVGALYVRRRDPVVRLVPQVTGGGQERGKRSGTLNVPGIIGFAEALRLGDEERVEQTQRLRSLRDGLYQQLCGAVPGMELIGPPLNALDDAGADLRLTHNLNLALPGLDGETLMMRTPGVAMSSGAACSSTDPEPSHVLRALGLSEERARCSVRIGLGRFTTADETGRAAAQISDAISAMVRG